MPYSSELGKKWIRQQVVGLPGTQGPIDSVLDIGAGSGTYARLLRPWLPGARFTAIEIHHPYVDRFALHALYQEVIIGNVVDLELPGADVVVLGDVIEHLTHEDALAVWGKARRAAGRAVFLSVPIVEWPQGEVDGNPHEAHLHTWTVESVVRDLRGITTYAVDGPIGVFQASGLAGVVKRR